jgi:hypothetical protein
VRFAGFPAFLDVIDVSLIECPGPDAAVSISV